MSVVITDYTELHKYIGNKLFLKNTDKYLYMGILTKIDIQNNKFRVPEIMLKFQDKREYINRDLNSEYLLL